MKRGLSEAVRKRWAGSSSTFTHFSQSASQQKIFFLSSVSYLANISADLSFLFDRRQQQYPRLFEEIYRYSFLLFFILLLYYYCALENWREQWQSCTDERRGEKGNKWLNGSTKADCPAFGPGTHTHTHTHTLNWAARPSMKQDEKKQDKIESDSEEKKLKDEDWKTIKGKRMFAAGAVAMRTNQYLPRNQRLLLRPGNSSSNL